MHHVHDVYLGRYEALTLCKECGWMCVRVLAGYILRLQAAHAVGLSVQIGMRTKTPQAICNSRNHTVTLALTLPLTLTLTA